MQAHQIIRASAEVVTITALAPGDVYKRVDTTSYSGESKLQFGIVQSVMNNGEDAAVSALEFSADYSGITPALKVYDGSQPVAIYPATPDEVRLHLDDVTKAADDAVEKARRSLADAEAKAAMVRDTLATHAASLTAPATKLALA
jgi:hypothetical protein